jgi:hypothetical protein
MVLHGRINSFRDELIVLIRQRSYTVTSVPEFMKVQCDSQISGDTVNCY